MKISREAMLGSLDIIRPAVASKDLVEELVHLWFDGTTVMAYNDKVGIEVPMKTDFVGGLRGSLVLGMLGASRAKEVVLEPVKGKDDQMRMTAAAAKITLPLLPEERKVWEFPDTKRAQMSVISADLIGALEKALVTVGTDISVADQLGVTLISDGNTLCLYSTDSNSMTECLVPKPKDYKGDRVILSSEFCEQLVRLCKNGGHLSVLKDCVIAENPSGTRLYGRLIESTRPLRFVEVIERILPPKHKDKMIAIPSRTKLILERLSVLLEGHPGHRTTMGIAEGALYVEAKTAYGELSEDVKIEGEHAEVEVEIDHSLIKRVLPYATQMLLVETALILTGDNDYMHLIATYQKHD